jgi:agmatine deiminase
MAFRLAAEFAPQDWLWIGFPHDPAEWPSEPSGELLGAAQAEIAGFANAVAESGQDVRLIVRDDANAAAARRLVSAKVTLEQQSYGDIWLRDTGPLTGFENGQRTARRFGFNGWGGKFEMTGDQTIGADLARGSGLSFSECPMIFEGGAIDHDGTGLAITTEQCLLNPNRNPSMDKDAIEQALGRGLGLKRIVWLGQGLEGDHTDGHVDNLARFVGEGHVAIPKANEANDPNAAIFADAKKRAEAGGLKVSAIPSAGMVMRDGAIEAASYANFVIANHLVIVPQFGSPRDQDAVAQLDALFSGRTAIGLPASAVLAGGGSFHCASQHVPASKQG